MKSTQLHTIVESKPDALLQVHDFQDEAVLIKFK